MANARLEGLEKDLGLSADGTDYLNGLTLFFVGYISLEVEETWPSNLAASDRCRLGSRLDAARLRY